MKSRSYPIIVSALLCSFAASAQTTGSENVETPEIDACRASGLIALKERSTSVKDVELDLDSARIVKLNSKIGSTEVRAIVLADASIEKKKSSKSTNFICVLGEKGRVLLAIFTDQ
jgi:hypothetical protein